MMRCCRGAFCVDCPASGLRPALSALLRGVSVSQTLFTQYLRFSGAIFAVQSRYILSDQLGAASLWLGWLRSIDLGFDKCRDTLRVILGAGTGVSWPRSAPTMPITAATIRRSVTVAATRPCCGQQGFFAEISLVLSFSRLFLSFCGCARQHFVSLCISCAQANEKGRRDRHTHALTMTMSTIVRPKLAPRI